MSSDINKNLKEINEKLEVIVENSFLRSIDRIAEGVKWR